MKKVNVILLILCLVLLIFVILSQANNAEDKMTSEIEKIYYTPSEQMELFSNQQESFQDLQLILSSSEYKYLAVDQIADGKIIWRAPTLVVDSDGLLEKVLEIDKNDLNSDVVCTVDMFYEKYHCRSIEWYEGVLIVSFWNEWGNDGLLYMDDVPSEPGSKFYVELGNNWYYFSFPTI